jgi:error-prone DNA polymerase
VFSAPIPIRVAYAELLTRSCFSLLDGASQPEELVRAAAASGAAHLGLVDRDGVYGVVQAVKVADELGVNLVFGASLTVGGRASVAVLVQDRAGWTHLCELLTLGRNRREKGRCEVTVDELASRAGGLVGVLRPGWTAAEAGPLADGFGSRLRVTLSRDLSAADVPRVRAARLLARSLDAPLLATNDVRFHAPERRLVADVLTCIRRRTTLAAAGRHLLPNAERHLLTEAGFRDRYRDFPDAIGEGLAVAESCTFRLDELRYGYPREVVPDGQTPMSWLRELTERGLRWRFPEGVPAKVRAQVEHELAVVAELDFPSYFLTVYDAVRFARSQGILCQGRGSAANSAVCYALGVTSVDPSRTELLFERFLSKERGEPPDIDVDFEHERREEVIQYVYARYGRDRAAMVNEFICYRQRSAVREVGKVFGLSLDQVDRLARALDRWSAGLPEPASRDEPAPSDRARRKSEQPHEGRSGPRFAPAADDVAPLVREAGLDPDSDEVRATLQVSASLSGFPRHVSIHVGGFVISARSLAELVPVEPATMEGRTVLQWDKYDVEALEFVKVDLLSLGMLTAIRKSFDLIEGEGGPTLDLATVPAEDPVVYDMFCRADTVGVFQIESRAQMSMLPRLKPRCFYDLVVEVAIVRPGPIQGGMVHPYLRRRSGDEPVTYAHPTLVPILERTLGVPLFQEQVMAMAVAVGGFTAGQADQLRRAMGAWRKRGNLLEMGRKLVQGMTERGIAPDYAEAVFAQILGFGEYGFPESHAASFALLVYVSGWLKCHWPAAFAAALVNSQPMGFYSPRALLADAARHGVRVLPVCVVSSGWDCTLEGGAIRCGLRLIAGLGEEHGEAIVDTRAQRPFGSLLDFAARTRLDRGRLTTLADAGAFDELVGGDRRKAAWILQGAWTGLPLFSGLGRQEPEPVLRPMSVLERLHADYRSVGLSVDLHPVSLIRAALDEQGCVPVASLVTLPSGERAAVVGLVSNRQRPGTSNGVVFMTLEDESGLANLVIWPRTWQEHRTLARNARILGAVGVVQRQGDAVSLLVERFFTAPEPPPEASEPETPPLATIDAPSRDFH